MLCGSWSGSLSYLNPYILLVRGLVKIQRARITTHMFERCWTVPSDLDNHSGHAIVTTIERTYVFGQEINNHSLLMTINN